MIWSVFPLKTALFSGEPELSLVCLAQSQFMLEDECGVGHP